MKLVRFGPRGREKPGIIDAKGRIRDLSKVVPDIAGDALSPKGLAKIRKAPIDKLPLVKGNPRLGPASARSATSSPSGSTIPTTPPKPACRSRRNRSSSTRQTCICGPNDDTIIPKDLEQARLGG